MPLLSHSLPCFVMLLLFRLFIWQLSKIKVLLGMSIICFSFTPGCSITTIENQASILNIMITPLLLWLIIHREKLYAQASIKVFALYTMYRVRQVFVFLLFLTWNGKQENHHGGFQQQSPQYTVYRYEYMNGRNDRWMMRLKPIQVEYYPVENQKSYSNTM